MEEIVPVHFRNENSISKKLIPLVLCLVVLAADQITKYAVVANIDPYTIGKEFFGGLLRIIHVWNTGVAFSIGTNLPEQIRKIVFAVLPLAVLIAVMVIYFRSADFTQFQRWMICGIVGGGLGNLADRFFRKDGVVDFIDVKFFGIFGYERWPTFNLADMSVVICGILLLISFAHSIIIQPKDKAAENKGDEK